MCAHGNETFRDFVMALHRGRPQRSQAVLARQVLIRSFRQEKLNQISAWLPTNLKA
jgi:uncharacterized iron-regulated protein